MKIAISIGPVLKFFEDLQEILEILISKELGFNIIEIHTDFVDEHFAHLLKLSEKFNISYLTHLPHLYSKEKVNFCSANKKDFEKARFWMGKTIDIAKELNSKFITLHPDPPKKCSKNKAKEILYNHIKKALSKLNKKQMILIENMPSSKYTLSTPQEIRDFIKKFKSKQNQIGCTWDTTHSIIAIDKKYLNFPLVLGNKIKEVHISDIKNGGDHLPLGKGDLNLKEIIKNLRKIKYNGNIVFEIVTDNIKDIKNSKDILKRALKKS